MTARELAEAAFARAVRACELDRRVAEALAALAPVLEPGPARRRLGIAIGKAALAMARGAPVERGIAVVPAGGDAEGQGAPEGWRVIAAAHPEPDERSAAAGRAVRELVESAAPGDVVIALVSGGASALVEQPRIPLAELRALAGALMAAGAPIGELNTVRGALSELKAGRLALACAAPIVTLVASDVVGDRLDVVGSGPTIGPWLAAPGAQVEVGLAEEARRREAIAILERRGLAVPAALAAPIAPRRVARADRAVLVAPLAAFADAACAALAAAGVPARRLDPPLTGDVAAAARRLAAEAGPFVAWGEPTLRVPADHGDGGRAQQLALALARLVRGTARALLVAGTDGVDGPPPRGGRPAPAGAFVDGGTWDAIARAGIDPALALARCDAGTALAAAGALFAPGPTGVNHADVALDVPATGRATAR
jgi:glycerate 2-kinase